MTAAHPKAREHVQLIRGEGQVALCVWEPGLVRTTREARALASAGCAHAPSEPSPEMRAFLRLYVDRFAAHLGPASFTLGCVCIGGTGDEARTLLEDLAELAGEFGLSYLQPDGLVRLRLGAYDPLPIAAILGLLAGGVVAHARLRDGAFRLVLRYIPDVFVATVRTRPALGTAALRLLGFRVGRRGAWQQRFDTHAHATARALVRVLHATAPQPADLDTTLAPREALVPLQAPDVTHLDPAARS